MLVRSWSTDAKWNFRENLQKNCEIFFFRNKDLFVDKQHNLHYDISVKARTETSSMEERFQRAGTVEIRQNESI